jgi:cytochrome o ubiquinol oxidase subunit II
MSYRRCVSPGTKAHRMSRQATRYGRISRAAKAAAAIAPAIMLGGCDLQVLYPAGDVAAQQAHILAVSTGLMLLIVVPVMAVTVLFAWRYRASNREATYRPDWEHSTMLELLIWSAPLLIIIAVGAITWISTHTLDPYRRLAQIAPGEPVPANSKPLEVEVVALDWKWLFIYPEQGIATVNELAIPIDREVRFRLTASSVMNSFYVPAMAGQIYAMPGMETKLHGVLNRQGEFEGFSANYSGAGFSGMHFRTHGLDDAGFAAWVAQRKARGKLLDVDAYRALARPSENVRPGFWSSVAPDLFQRVAEQCVEPGQTCMTDMMRMDRSEQPMPGMRPGQPPAPAATPATHSHT